MKSRMLEIIVFLILLVIASALPVYAKKAIDTEGRTIILHDDGTWEVEAKTVFPMVEIPSEKALYSMIKYDRDDAILKLYLDYYEGVDLKNTISVIYHYCFLKPNTEEFYLWRIRGIVHSEQYGKVFMITIGPYENEIVSNLVFYWDVAQSMEDNGNFLEALKYYELLKEYFIGTNGKYKYNVLISSLDQINTKIFKMKLLLSKQ